METYEYNDGLRPGGRRPRLYLAKGGEARKFSGENILGWYAVATAEYTQAGKWSHTTYQLLLAPGVRALHFMSSLHGTWGDDISSWGEVAVRLALPVGVAQQLVRSEFPTTASRLDKAEEFALAVEAEGGETETVVVSFGGPTNRAIREGYWGAAKRAQTSDGRTVTVEPKQGEHGADWRQPTAVEPEGAKVVSARHSPGIHGGYWAVEVVVPIAANGRTA